MPAGASTASDTLVEAVADEAQSSVITITMIEGAPCCDWLGKRSRAFIDQLLHNHRRKLVTVFHPINSIRFWFTQGSTYLFDYAVSHLLQPTLSQELGTFNLSSFNPRFLQGIVNYGTHKPCPRREEHEDALQSRQYSSIQPSDGVVSHRTIS